ncbi:MAG: transporter substrate-binding domain-containing protein, partial [Synergistaceae bacterium]|nr:transporter substrate-binding domain-containing protein [Synergistaceae bacterium]
MKKVVLPLMVLVLCVCSCAQAKPAKVGVLAPIGQDEKDIIQWTENVADLEGRVKMFRNSSTISIYDDLNAMVMALKAGQIDRISIGLHTARYIAARDEAFEFIDNDYNAVMGYAVAVREDDKARLPGINLAIQKMRADGTLERLIKEHILTVETEDPKAVEIPKFKGEDTIRFAVTGDLPPMDCILADGTPAGFNTAFLAELAAHIKKNIELVSVSAGARQAAIASGKVDALFWTRGVYNRTFQVLPYPVDKVSGVVISEPYLLESRAAVAMKQPEKGAKLRYIAQLKTEKLAAQRGTVGQF